MPAYIRKKALDPGRKIECAHAKMMGKFPNVQFGIRFSTWNVDLCRESGHKYLRL